MISWPALASPSDDIAYAASDDRDHTPAGRQNGNGHGAKHEHALLGSAANIVTPSHASAIDIATPERPNQSHAPVLP